MAEDGFFIHQFELGPMENFIYLIGDKRTRECAVVDPAWNYEIILEEAARLDVEIKHMLCTHSHFTMSMRSSRCWRMSTPRSTCCARKSISPTSSARTWCRTVPATP